MVSWIFWVLADVTGGRIMGTMNGKKRVAVVTSRRSEQAQRAVQDRRRSNAAGKHADRRTKRLRTRAAARAAALREQA